MVKVIAEDEVFARDGTLGREGKRDRVTVVRVLRGREVGGGGGRVFRETCTIRALAVMYVEKRCGGRKSRASLAG